MEILYIIFGLIAILLLVIILYVGADIKIIIYYIFNRKNLRFKMIKKLKKGEKDLYLLGSLHGLHFKLPEFSYMHLKAALINIKPDLLLLESRQAEIEKGNFADGPLEMLYLHLAAKDLGIEVKGIDWFEYGSGQPGKTSKKRDQLIHENIINNLDLNRKTLVVFGASHLLIELKKIVKKGYKVITINKEEASLIYENVEEKLRYHTDTAKE
ncbi:MAG: hypothetical protein PHX62_02825 [Bacilli bacterium]|nr:hypothetical protein [Bacilli bacterium]